MIDDDIRVSAKLTSKAFLSELDDLRAELRREIEAHQAGLDASKDAIKARRKRVLDGDFRFFAYTYFPHHIRGEPSIFQKAFCERFPKLLRQAGGCKEWWLAPRGEAKSSLLTKIGPVWCAVQGLLQRPAIRTEIGMTGAAPPFIDYIVMLGAETSLPTKLIEVVKAELTMNAALQLDFPEVCGRGKLWKVGEIITKTNVKVEPFGAEQAIRGTFHGSSRPKLLLPDDVITDAEAKSPTERENRWNWLEKSIDYLGPPDGSVKCIGVGTVLNKDDPISRAKKAIGHLVHHYKAIEKLPDDVTNEGGLWNECEELMRNADPAEARERAARGLETPDSELPSFKFYAKHKKAMDKGAVTSWPSVRSLYWLMRQRAKNAAAFGTEMQGDPRSDEDRVFTHITFFVSKIAHWVMLGACDPSMGKNEKSHPSALIAGGYDREAQVLNVLACERKRRLPTKLLSDLCEWQRWHRCAVWGFENVNAYEYMRTSFVRDALSQHAVRLPLIGIDATVDRVVRIDGMEPYINDAFSPRIKFHADAKQLLAEMDTWPETQTDHDYDALCALEILWQLSVKRYSRIEYRSTAGMQGGSVFAGQGAV